MQALAISRFLRHPNVDKNKCTVRDNQGKIIELSEAYSTFINEERGHSDQFKWRYGSSKMLKAIADTERPDPILRAMELHHGKVTSIPFLMYATLDPPFRLGSPCDHTLTVRRPEIYRRPIPRPRVSRRPGSRACYTDFSVEGRLLKPDTFKAIKGLKRRDTHRRILSLNGDRFNPELSNNSQRKKKVETPPGVDTLRQLKHVVTK
jgi:hypothetical protein